MTSGSEPSTKEEPDKHDHQVTTAEEHDDFLRRVGWKALFGFTTRKHLPVFFTGFLCAVIVGLVGPAVSVIFGLLFRGFSDYGSGKITGSTMLHNSSKYCLYVTGIMSASWLASSAFYALFLVFGELQARSARERMFDALLRKDIAWYDTRKGGVAALLPTIQMQIRDLQLSTSSPFGQGVQEAATFLGAFGVAMYFAWDLTLVTISTMPLIYLLTAFSSNRLSKHESAQSAALQNALKYLTSALSSIETVKCFNGERSELSRYTSAIGRAGVLYNRVANVRSAQIGILQFFGASIFVQGFWYGSYLVSSGRRNPGQIVTAFYAASMAVTSLTSFMPQFIIIQKGRIAGARLRSIMDHISGDGFLEEAVGHERPGRCAGDIEFRKVSFAYPTRPDQPALKQASIFFPAGETTFVVGRSGSGKSTLSQLLVRFYKPSEGEIFLDGTPIRSLDANWLRENITLVEQHSVLFNESIRRNISLVRPGEDVSDKQVDHVVDFALLQQVIKDLPKGLDTLTGAQGNSLSGGQRQRVALARARLRDTPILILDESTSALDYITRFAMLDAIRSWRKGKTTIIITHDITQIQPSDCMYILDQAQVVTEGYREALEADPNSAFHNFLDSVEDTRRRSMESFEGHTDELLDLYEASWASIPPQPPATSSEVMFGREWLSPIFSPSKRTSVIRNSQMLERRPSHPMVIDPGEDDFEEHYEAQIAIKLPPRSATIIRKEEVSHPARPPSRRVERPLSSCGSPINPRRFSGSGSPIHSRPTSMVQEIPIRLDVREAPPIRGRLSVRRAMRRSRIEEKEKADGGDESLHTVKSMSILDILKTFWPRLDWQSKMCVFGAVSCAVVHAAATPVFAFVFAKLQTTFYIVENRDHLAMVYSLAILGIALADGLTTYGMYGLFDVAAQHWANSIKSEAMRRMLMQPREFFDEEKNSISRLAETLDHFGEEARNLVGRFSSIVIVIVVMIGTALVWSFIACWQLSAIILATVPVIFGIMTAYNMTSGRWERLSNEADERIGQVLHETFVNIRTVRCLVLGDVFRKKFDSTAVAALTTGMKRALYTGSLFGINYVSVLFVAILAFWFGAWLISKEHTTVSKFLESVTILLLASNSCVFFIGYIPQINIAKDAAARLIRLATLPEDSHEFKGTTQLDSAGAISFRNAVFSYPTRKDQEVLHGIDMDIPRGSCIAIVGSSGSGKSTIAALLLKLYQMEAATGAPRPPLLTISGHDIRELHTPTLRSRMAIVSQTPVMFPGTIAENIAYGLPSSSSRASPENIRAAAIAAGVDDFISSLPSGYQTLIGVGGSGLSGGQAQRIAIARALVRNPDILILDEATSALDVESANTIRETVQRLVADMRKEDGKWPLDGRVAGNRHGGKRQMTVIIITHAREMMAIAEHIIMLDKGRVVEEGSFENLRRSRGAFARLLRGEAE